MGLFDDIAAKIRQRNKETAQKQAESASRFAKGEADKAESVKRKLHEKVGALRDYLEANLSTGSFGINGPGYGEEQPVLGIFSKGDVWFYKVRGQKIRMEYGVRETSIYDAFVFGFDFAKKVYIYGEYQALPGPVSPANIRLNLFEALTLEGIQTKVIESAIACDVIK